MSSEHMDKNGSTVSLYLSFHIPILQQLNVFFFFFCIMLQFIGNKVIPELSSRLWIYFIRTFHFVFYTYIYRAHTHNTQILCCVMCHYLNPYMDAQFPTLLSNNSHFYNILNLFGFYC